MHGCVERAAAAVRGDVLIDAHPCPRLLSDEGLSLLGDHGTVTRLEGGIVQGAECLKE